MVEMKIMDPEVKARLKRQRHQNRLFSELAVKSETPHVADEMSQLLIEIKELRKDLRRNHYHERRTL